MARTRLDRSTLEAALIGLQLQRDEIEAKMAELRRQVAGRDGTRHTGSSSPVRKRHRMSAEARKRIAAAQKIRWAEYRKKQKAA